MSLESSRPQAKSWWFLATSPSTTTTTTTSAAVSRRETKSKASDSKDQDIVTALVGILLELGAILVTSYVASILIQRVLKSANGSSGGDEDTAVLSAAEKRLRTILQREGKDTSQLPPLTNYEKQIAQDVVDPIDIPTHFADIGGIDGIKQELWELAVLPLQRPDLFSSSHLLQAPGGILLYGPPGTGKTMLAKAIAKEADATFIAVKLSKIMNKWFGESNKLIDAIFSLARKLAPSVIFVDELDTFLNPRDGSENSAGNAIKAEFLTLWDGITTNKEAEPVMVLGATNRPNQVDSAILRRLPRMFKIGLPDEAGRLQILKLTLKTHPLDASAQTYLPHWAKTTVGYSGSDLKELCQCAAMEAVREVMREHSKSAVSNAKVATAATAAKKRPQTKVGKNDAPKIRPMSKRDMVVAQLKIKRTGHDAAAYEEEEEEATAKAAGSRRSNNAQQRQMLEGLAALSKLLANGGGLPAIPGAEDADSSEDDTDDIPQM